jgi:hypothetical protein
LVRDDSPSTTIESITETDPKFCRMLNTPISEKNDRMSISDFIDETLRASVSSFGRLLKLNVLNDKISFLPIEGIGMVHGLYSIPSPYRTYQVPTAMIIICCGKKTTDHYPLRDRSVITKDELLYSLLAIIVVRTSGNPVLFKLFAEKINGKMTSGDILLPTTEILFQSFLDFLSSDIGEKESMGQFLCVLYSNLLASIGSGTVEDYRQFLVRIQTEIRKLISDDEFSKWQARGWDYTQWVGNLTKLISLDRFGKFVSSIILCDLNELFRDAVYNTSNMEFGPYAKAGMRMLELRDAAMNERQKFSLLTTSLFAELKARTDVDLSVMGLEKNADKEVVISLNKRKLFEVDVECAICKLVVCNRKTGGAFSGSIKFDLHHRLYEWPLHFLVGGLEVFETIGNKAVRSYIERTERFKNVPIHDICKYKDDFDWNERTAWATSCEMVLSKVKYHPLLELTRNKEKVL